MNANQQLITRFYQAFQKKDAAGMAACYHQDIHFTDAAFPDLHGPQAGMMWKMLTERGKDLKVEFRDVRADDKTGSAHWDAYYTFTKTGRSVHNSIDARFEFKDGLIIRHVDTFDFHRWAGQALGPAGKLLGGFGFMQKKVQTMAAAGLAEFTAQNSSA